jgi:hypothetical protein
MILFKKDIFFNNNRNRLLKKNYSTFKSKFKKLKTKIIQRYQVQVSLGVFESVLMVAFQNVFRLEIYQNNIFLKNYF